MPLWSIIRRRTGRLFGWAIPETLQLMALIVLIAAVCAPMIYEGWWRAGIGPGMTAFPHPSTSLAAACLVYLMTLQAAFGITACFSRRLRLSGLIISSIVSLPLTYLYGFSVDEIGFGAPAVQIDEFARAGAALISAFCLMLPWFFWRLRWPRRSAGHLAIGVAIVSGLALHIIFHLVLVVPGSQEAHIQFERMVERVHSSRSGEELGFMAEVEALPLVELDPDADVKTTLVQSGVVEAAGYISGIAKIREAAPRVLHTWQAGGKNSVDRILMIYDGRAEPARFWIIPADATARPRLAAISAYYALVGISSFVWLSLALIVSHFHARRNNREACRG